MSDENGDFRAPNQNCANRAPYLLGTLNEVERDAFERHLIACEPCQAECEDLGPMVTSLGLVAPDEAQALLAEPEAGDADGPRLSWLAHRSYVGRDWSGPVAWPCPTAPGSRGPAEHPGD